MCDTVMNYVIDLNLIEGQTTLLTHTINLFTISDLIDYIKS
jgi:hypothetical protein